MIVFKVDSQAPYKMVIMDGGWWAIIDSVSLRWSWIKKKKQQTKQKQI